MTLSTPWGLGWLALLPVLYWLSLPPRPRRFEFTAHFAEWQAALAALRRRPRQAGLRFVLLASALVAIALAAAGAAVPGRPGPQRLVVLLDRSASMLASAPAGRAAARAAAQLANAFAALPEPAELTVLTIGAGLERRHGASARYLQDLPTPAGGLDVDLAALAAATASADTAVWTLTDGQGQRGLPTVGALTVLAARGDNAGVLAVVVQDQWPLPTLQVAVEVVGFPAAPAAAELLVEGAVEPVPPVPLLLAPGEVVTHTLQLVRQPAGGELRCRVRLPGDVLAADDGQTLWLPPLPAPRIAARSDGEAGPFVRAAAAALAAEVAGQVVAAGAGDDVGLLLVDGGRVLLTPGTQRVLTFGTALRADGELVAWREPRVIDWDRRSPLTAGLDLSELRLDTAWRGVLPEGEALLWAEHAGQREPLAVVVGDERCASVHFAFRLQDGNLPLLPAFPQLLRRAFVRCYGAGAALRVLSAPPVAGELDLRTAAAAPDRPLPAFATPEQDLAAWCVLAGLALLALRSCVR
ncbi:MAG: hypothetical protein IT455_07980 [Planctomycetes bacterium]|nr:hypothetical protein [Planctomycetota bacterium]